ncbi:MAG TPA: protein translocase SEC61 complex subunit gamma [Candidatus Thermoplasmatota archaeon]|nr:protein translocase SEC61 complex subunit gamma [Candidatus Thermoplasmatota archaeon]
MSDGQQNQADKGFLAGAWRVQRRMEKAWDSIGKGRYARVLKMARKPEPEEFRQSSTIVLVGIAVMGAIGFAIYLFMQWILRLLES